MRIVVVIACLAFATALPAVAQTRVNTSKAAEALNREADKAQQQAQRLKAEELKLLSDAQRWKFAEQLAKAELDKVDQKIANARKEQLALLSEMVWKLMSDDEAGSILQQDPALIREIPDIKDLISEAPWASSALAELMFQWTGKRI